ncbi:ROK family transcriptional regulator [Mycolicibacterium sp. CBM1]
MDVVQGPGRRRSIKAMNEQLLVDHLRAGGQLSRAELAELTGLSKPTVSAALSVLTDAGLVRISGHRVGVPGPSAQLYEFSPDAGHVLALDVGHRYLRGAVCDLTGQPLARCEVKAPTGGSRAAIRELVKLRAELAKMANLSRQAITQTVIGTPGIFDADNDAIRLASVLSGWGHPSVVRELRAEFGQNVMFENDVNASALAEQALGHGRDVQSFAFVSVGTGIGMGLILDGKLHRGAHRVAGEIGYLPLVDASSTDERDARRRGRLEASASAAGVVRAARRAGMTGVISAERVFAAASKGDARAEKVVANEAIMVAKAICSVVAVADPELVVIGGGIGRANGFAERVKAELGQISPVIPELRVSALGEAGVVDGCLAAGVVRAWANLARF